MDTTELARVLGRIEGKVDGIQGKVSEMSEYVQRNTDDIRELQLFRARTKGIATLGGVLTSTLAGAVGFYAKLKGLI